MSILTKIVWASSLIGSAANAQNSDLGLLLGWGSGSALVVLGPGNTSISGSGGVSGQITYAWQVLGRRAGDLYVELPFITTANASGIVTNTVTGSVRNTIFFTPGVRYKFNPEARVAVYGVIGGGVGSFSHDAAQVSTNSVSAVSSRTTTGVLGLGGGIDFRLTRLLSLRVEARDFVSRAGLGGQLGRNHLVIQGGIGFHF